MSVKSSVIIAAAGASKRMGGGLNKQYRMCEDLPVLVRTVKAFRVAEGISQIIVSVPPGDIDFARDLLAEYGETDLTFVAGGAERMDTVLAALAAVGPECSHVLVHDGARPFVTSDVIHRVLKALEDSDAVIPCVSPKNTIRTADATLDRNTLYEVQTPQGFRTDVLKTAYNKAFADGFKGTDEASITEHSGVRTVIVEGDYKNIKITTPEDIPKMIRTGMGYDVHRLVPGRPLMLGCIEVPYEKGLLGHSDADVMSHAAADALLGAAAMGDIGKHFPDNDPACEGMPGSVLLAKTAVLIAKRGYSIVSLDVTLVAQKPKISPHTEAMRKAMAQALSIDVSKVSVKATTEEGLGISGSCEAMAAYAIASIQG